MKRDLLKEIGSMTHLQHVIVLTHNIDFLFLQTVAMAALKRGGSPRITVFADAQCADESFREQQRIIGGALGTRYRTVSVPMTPGFRFHPKAILLAGEKGASLYVGSGNLTFGGWRENAEVWLRFDAAVDGSSPFRQCRDYVAAILTRLPLAEGISVDVENAFANALSHGSHIPANDAKILIGHPSTGDSLISQLLAGVGDAPVDELYVCSPYYDAPGRALQELSERIQPKQVTLLYQPKGSTLNAAVLRANPKARLRHVEFPHQGKDDKPRSAFVHAKFYALVRQEEVTVVAGSANCSVAALTLVDTMGNAELMGIRRMPVSEFETEWLGGFVAIDDVVLPPEHPPEEEQEVGNARLRVLAARFEDGRLQAAFQPTTAVVQQCAIDGVQVLFSILPDCIIEMHAPELARSLVITALVGVDAEAQSASRWIDHEFELRAESFRHPVAEAIPRQSGEDTWSASAWNSLLTMFCTQISKFPKGITQLGSTRQKRADEQKETRHSYSWDDVFAPGYEVPLNPLTISSNPALAGNHEESLQAMLCRWFSVPDPTKPREPSAKNPAESDNGDGWNPEDARGDGDDEDVDQPYKFRKGKLPKRPKEPRAAKDANAIAIAKVLKNMTKALTDSKFCESRPAQLLSTDLQLTAVLLGTGLKEQWITGDQYFAATNHVWCALFLFGDKDSPDGWIAKRADVADPGFMGLLSTPLLSAALLGWAFPVGLIADSAESARFQIASALAVARYPRLWFGGDTEDVAIALQSFVAHATPADAVGDQPDRLYRHWTTLLQRGQAFRELESSLTSIGCAKLQERLDSICIDEITAGELLWQGKSGYCIAKRRFYRGGQWPVEPLWISNPQKTNQVLPGATIPIRTVLGELASLTPQPPSRAAQAVILQFLNELRLPFQPTPTDGLDRVTGPEMR